MEDSKLFSLHEAVILLDAYLRTLSGTDSYSSALRQCSDMLRQLAVNEGREVDPEYRDIADVSWRMQRMQVICNGEPSLLPVPACFTEAVNLYTDHKDEYDRVLAEAQELSAVPEGGTAVETIEVTQAPTAPAQDTAAETSVKGASEKTESSAQGKLNVLLCYNFDTVLCEDTLPVGVGEDTAGIADARLQESDVILEHMYRFVETAVQQGKKVDAAYLTAQGQKLKLRPGLSTWFDRIDAVGAQHGIAVKHCALSQGIREMVLGTAIAPHFASVCASSYMFGSDGTVVWPLAVMDSARWGQEILRMEQDIWRRTTDLSLMENPAGPCGNVIYIGSGVLDGALAFVNRCGGMAIGAYTTDKEDAYILMEDRDIDLMAPADFSEGSELERYVVLLLEMLAQRREVMDIALHQREEVRNWERRA